MHSMTVKPKSLKSSEATSSLLLWRNLYQGIRLFLPNGQEIHITLLPNDVSIHPVARHHTHCLKIEAPLTTLIMREELVQEI